MLKVRTIAAALLGLLLLTAGTPARAAQNAADIAVVFPDQLGGFAERGVQRYPQPGYGYSIRYVDGDVRVDVFVYDAGERAIPDGSEAPVVVRHFDDNHRGIQQYYAQQRQPATVAQLGPVVSGGVRWLSAEYDVLQGGAPMHSVLMVTGFRNRYVKIRATYPATATRGRLAPFVAALSELLTGPGSGPVAPGK